MEITRVVKDIPYDESAAAGQRQTLTVAELERFCRLLRRSGAVDRTPVAFRRTAESMIFMQVELRAKKPSR